MLSPDHRRLYSDALKPPPGYRFREAIATTYSLDLQTLLTVPLHLALFSAEQPLDELLQDGVALLESIRRTVRQVTVYSQASRILIPRSRHILYGLLEPSVVEVTPPGGGPGAFHPKLWVLRFEREGHDLPLVRVLVLTRNLTGDRCWDLKLTLEGQPATKPLAANQPLAELIRRLPGLALLAPPAGRSEQANQLADLVHRTVFEPPGDFADVRFHAIGLEPGTGWVPPRSDRLAVISPFVSEAAVRKLVATTAVPLALISRPESLAALPPELLNAFERVLVLSEQAEREDGEEGEAPIGGAPSSHGLHAKAYLAKQGWNTHLFVGSANATNPALIHGSNVEIVAELVGRWKRVGEVDDLLMADNFGSILVDYSPDDALLEVEPEVERARRMLEEARRALAAGAVRVRFTPDAQGWSAELVPTRALSLAGVRAVRVWLVTRDEATAVDGAALTEQLPVCLPAAPLELLTTFVAFELLSEMESETVRFVLNLESDGLPQKERDAAIVRGVIRNRDGFLRYLLLLLAEAGVDLSAGFSAKRGRHGGAGNIGFADDLPLFEHLTSALCRDPDRLRSIRQLLDELGDDGDDMIPPEFLDLWAIFESALSEAA